jgi:ubiquinone/menaquinone biosynthesis C-methylase UbiE
MEKEMLHTCPHLNYDEKHSLVHNSEMFTITSKLIASGKPNKILDVGICTAVFYEKFLPNFLKSGSIYGIDIEKEFLNIAESRGVKTKLCNIDKENIPFEDNMFDTILCDSILEHTLNPKGLLLEISRVLKKNGKLILCVPNAISLIRIIDMLRGRSPFHAIIDNLFHMNFMKRCAILYSPNDLKWVIGKQFELEKMILLDRPQYDPKTISVFISRLLSKLFPNMRDMIIIEAIKK